MARALRVTALAAVAASLAVGCAGASGSGGAVRFLVFGDPEEIKAYRELIAAYERRSDGRRIRLVEASDRSDLIARLATSVAGGSPPDVFLINYRFYGQFAAKGVLEPLERRVERSDVFGVGDFYPEALAAFRWRGTLVCLPQNVSSLVVYFNRDLFRRYAVPEPEEGWTWNEMLARAGMLTRDERGAPIVAGDPDTGGKPAAVYGLGVEPTLIRIAPFVWSNGGALVDDERRPTRLALDSRLAREALAQFFQLRFPYGVVPSDVEVEAEDDEARFANGRLAMLLSSRRSTPTFRASAAFDWDVAPLPIHKRPAGILHSDAYCLTKMSGRKDDAWRFIEFANSPEGQRIVARTGRTVPSLIAVSRSRAFLDPGARPRSSRVFLDTIGHIRRVPSISTWPEIEDAAEGILENGMYLQRPIDEVLRELDRATRPIFARGESP